MKRLKTLKTSTIAVAATAALALCATSANAIPLPPPTTTSYDIVTFSATLVTNVSFNFEAGIGVTKSQKLVNKDLLNILTNSDFAGFSFPTGAKLVIAWDRDGDVLVVDKTGSNVLFDATYNNGNSSIASLVINPYNQRGAVSMNSHSTGPESGIASIAWLNNGSFQLYDVNAGLNIVGTGPSTEHLTLKTVSAQPSWTDSQTFDVYGANETNGVTGFELPPGTLSGKITMSGHGNGDPVPVIAELENF